MKSMGEGLRKITRRLKTRFDRKAIILMYHRVAEAKSDPWALSVTPQHFAEHLDVLRRYARPRRLGQLRADLYNERVPRRSVVITFDDGYADNLYNARPLLARYDIPATVFITTAYLDRECEFWWDELERLFLEPSLLPDTLCLKINGSDHRWELGGVARYGEDEFRQHRNWRVWDEAPTLRHSLYFTLWQLLQPLPEGERLDLLDKLRSWANDLPTDRYTRRTLSTQEVVALAQGGLVEVGSHTVTHPVLSAMPADLQRHEIRQSKAGLENILGLPVSSFAYPYGALCNYTDETVAIVREAGFACACSTLAGLVKGGADRFQMPRLQVQDWDGEEFFKQLATWFDDSAAFAD